MRKINWVTAIFLVVTPLIAVIWGGFHITLSGIRPVEVVLFALYIAATGFSITGGYHRLFAHGAYDCRRFVKVFYLLFGAAAFQHSVLSWASDHRRHHKNIDGDADPYNIKRGFFWAHVGWLLFDEHRETRDDLSNVPDLVADPFIRFQHRFYVPIAVGMGFGLPLALGFAVGSPWGCLLWAGVFRTVVVHHSTFLVNSLAHTLGSRPYSLAVSARDSVVTALLTFGEGYHNFHHRFATDYRNGVRHHQWDPTKWLIRGMAALGWAYDLYRVPREKIVEAEIECDLHRLRDRWKGHSDHAVAYARERIAEISGAVQRSAARLGELERELKKARASWGLERRRQIEKLRSELRAARREFHEARDRWRAALEELWLQPAPQPA
jgi:stearoyl-CoA desaturase (Delta-9 desaturase)